MFLLAALAAAAQTESGIPVTDSVVIAKCSACHPRDKAGNMERISWERTTPEGWQEAIKKMVIEKHVTLTPEDARSIVRYLSSAHGLAPGEAKLVSYYAERRIHDESAIIGDGALGDCTKCHPAARALLWRRSAADWDKLAESHGAQYNAKIGNQALQYLKQNAPLHSAEWEQWKERQAAQSIEGTWLVTARLPGHGTYFGEMRVDSGAMPGEFDSRVVLESVKNRSALTRTGKTFVFGGYAWRGRSAGTGASASPEDALNEAREALSFSSDGSTAEGRWFWGQYQEFGFDVKLGRPTPGPTLLVVDPPSLKINSQSATVRLLGANFPADLSSADLNLGPGVTTRRIVTLDSHQIVAEVDVAMDSMPGRRNVSVKSSVLRDALALYDRVDYIKVTPESSMAGFGSSRFARGYGQFEAIGYQRGPDGKPHTDDDLELGPVDADWSMEVFYAVNADGNDKIARVNHNGLLSPAAENPGVNSDIWVVAKALHDVNKDGLPLTGKGYVVVAIPEYTFDGRHYVRDLDRWIQEGSW